MARVVVCGYMVRLPLAGNMLAYLQYAFGLRRLGHEVIYVEESGWPYSCYEPATRDWRERPESGLRLVREVLHACGVDVPVVYVDRESGETDGMSRVDLQRVLSCADLLLNVGGVCWLPEFRLCGRRALIDMDPLFTQLGRFNIEIAEHEVHFSYGTNIGRAGCDVPQVGVRWWPTLPPVAPELWHLSGAASAPRRPFTTIANWSAYGGVTYQGERYGQKDEEFLRLLDLPGRTTQSLELALSGADKTVVARFRAAGWSIRDAGTEVSTDLKRYQSYIRNSRGELSAAKHAYVKTRSGWFSDRSVCYLASGRPVVVQDTGFRAHLPVDRGLLTFSTSEEAAESIERVNADYPAHCRAAQGLAQDLFSYRVVLPRLLDIALREHSRTSDESQARTTLRGRMRGGTE